MQTSKRYRQTKIVDSVFAFATLQEFLSFEDTWSFDIETTGLSPRKDEIIGFSFASRGFAAYVVLKAWEGGRLVDKISYEDSKALLGTLKTKKLITWNGSFDARFVMHKIGINLIDSIHADAMLMMHTINENHMSYGLKNSAQKFLGMDAADEQAQMSESVKFNGGSVKQYFMADAQVLAKYGLKDAEITYDLWDMFDEQLTPGLRELYEAETMPLYKTVIIPMELKGMPVDVEFMQDSLSSITEDLSKIEDKIQEAIHPYLHAFGEWFLNNRYPFKLSGQFKEFLGRRLAPEGWPRTDSGSISLSEASIRKAKHGGHLADNTEFERIITGKLQVSPALIRQIQLDMLADEGLKYMFNLSSKDHLKRLFFGTANTPSMLKEKAVSFTDKGNPQVNDEFLQIMAKKHPWVALLTEYNGLQKIKGSYIERFLEAQEDGVFYPSYFMHRTVSGRLSGDFQQLPRPLEDNQGTELERKYTNMIRQFFVSAPDWSYVDDDYNSLEPRVFAHVSGDPALQEIFHKDEDFYSKIAIFAEKLAGVSADKNADNYLGKVNKQARQKAKAYSLGIAYGLGPYALSKSLNISEIAAKHIHDGYLTGFPELKKWMDRTETLLFAQGHIETAYGRLRRFPDEVSAFKRYGKVLLDPLELWKRYNESPKFYADMKELASKVKNARNNAYNVQIQGLASHIINRAAIAVASEYKAEKMLAYICGSCHDELIVHCPDSELEKACEILQRHMENTVKLNVPLVAIPSVGKNYAESKK
jgi:DNA polymerase I-like protein with 3'-5' exonuclease and polymerase domains